MVIMRDVATYLAKLDIIRGALALYVLWPGYDDVAHHLGPWSSDAFRVLRQLFILPPLDSAGRGDV
jgi:hypothetical protein